MVVKESGVLDVGGRLRRGMGGRALRVLDGLLLALNRMLWPGLREVFIGYPSVFPQHITILEGLRSHERDCTIAVIEQACGILNILAMIMHSFHMFLTSCFRGRSSRLTRCRIRALLPDLRTL